MSPARVLAVVGPTATGKSDLAVELARRLGGEVVNADSMQLYQGMDIGTAKLSDAERRGVKHHLIDVWDVTRTASVADYQVMARDCVADIQSRGKVPILTGGSGLYVRAVIDRIEFPGTDAAIRAALEAELAVIGSGALHTRLRDLDPVTASVIPAENGRRIVRALEVIEITGASYTSALPAYESVYDDVVQIGLDRPTAELDARIERRVERMVDAGLLDEVRRLDAAGLRDGVTASRALGYKQFLDVVDGRSDVPTATALTAQATRRFVRRQRSWFRRDPRITWYDDPAAALAAYPPSAVPADG